MQTFSTIVACTLLMMMLWTTNYISNTIFGVSLMILGPIMLFLGLREWKSKQQNPTTNTVSAESLKPEIRDRIEQQQSDVSIIKLIRVKTGLDLLSAKELLESVKNSR